MINETSGRPVTYHPPSGPPLMSLCTCHPALRSPTGSGMLPKDAASVAAVPGQKRGVSPYPWG